MKRFGKIRASLLAVRRFGKIRTSSLAVKRSLLAVIPRNRGRTPSN